MPELHRKPNILGSGAPIHMTEIGDPLTGWATLLTEELLQKSQSALAVLWFGYIPDNELLALCNILGIRARQRHITTINEWKNLARTSHTVHYHDQNGKGTNWFEPGAIPYTIQQWSSVQPLTRTGEFTDKTIISVCDTVINKRILVDGNKRATILTSEVQSQKEPAIDISLYEWYGERVNMIFPCEFCHLYGTNPDAEKP